MANIQRTYEMAKEAYAAIGVDVEAALAKADAVPVSIHCWQGDDVLGFEGSTALTGGIQTTGDYPGRARTADELRADAEVMLGFIPGAKKFSLHASYAEFSPQNKVDRDALRVEHFQNWIDWAKANGLGLDFNATYFSHPLGGQYTLSHKDEKIRKFWIEHTLRSREISQAMGEQLGQVCINNIWVQDGEKEVPIDTLSPRLRLIDSLDKGLGPKLNEAHTLEAVESKLFGIGSENYVVGSHEFYMGYAMSRNKLLTLDAGHYHPTELVSAKITAVLPYVRGIMLHVSRPVRWDSDHVVLFDDELQRIMLEIARNDAFDRVYIGTDWFDASINRVFAWTVGVRNVKKAILAALLQPADKLRQFEIEDDYSSRLGYQEELKTMPFGAVWDYYCASQDVPGGFEWMAKTKEYEKKILAERL